MEGSQKSNQVRLKGNIHFTHDSLSVFSQFALWDTKKEELNMKGDVRFIHPSGQLKANRGFYKKKQQLFTGIGYVWAKDSSGKYTISGDTLNYFKDDDLLEIFGKGKAILLDGDSLKDTLTLRANFLNLKNKGQQAKAFKNVIITRGDLTLKCDSATLNRKTGEFKLTGNPVAYVRKYQISGDYMEGTLKDQKLEKLLVITNAMAKRDSAIAADSSESMFTEIYGDTLIAKFKVGQISKLETRSNSKSLFWDKDQPVFVNKGNSDLMYLSFIDGKPKSAILKGQARTYYHLFDKKELAGTNEAAGDSIKIDLGDETLEKIRIFGNRASGVFSGEKATSSKGKL
jgi:lipopolysaccharide export system protein LptA